jgi:hypothetical protein
MWVLFIELNIIVFELKIWFLILIAPMNVSILQRCVVFNFGGSFWLHTKSNYTFKNNPTKNKKKKIKEKWNSHYILRTSIQDKIDFVICRNSKTECNRRYLNYSPNVQIIFWWKKCTLHFGSFWSTFIHLKFLILFNFFR